MNEYLAFVDYLGKSIEGEYIYRFDFTNNPDLVWGEYFNVAPTIIIPDLQPENEVIVKSARIKLDKPLNIAKKNGCFSMQDCFDGIISLAFTELTEEDTIYCNDEPLKFDFGETFDTVVEKLNNCGYNFFSIVEKINGEEKIVDNLVESISNKEEFDKGDYRISFGDYSDVLTIRVGDKIKRDFIIEKLFNCGYNRVEYVSDEGQFSVRGYLIDIFSYNTNEPIRISFFGDEIEKIAKFNDFDQKELETIDEITIYGKVENENE